MNFHADHEALRAAPTPSFETVETAVGNLGRYLWTKKKSSALARTLIAVQTERIVAFHFWWRNRVDARTRGATKRSDRASTQRWTYDAKGLVHLEAEARAWGEPTYYDRISTPFPRFSFDFEGALGSFSYVCGPLAMRAANMRIEARFGSHHFELVGGRMHVS